jgi:hypothetical protein
MNKDLDFYKKDFQDNKYTKLNNILTERESKIISNVLNFEYENKRTIGDELVLGAHSGALPILDSLLLVLQPIVESVTQLKLHPTYGYYRVYRPGAVLPKHNDRVSCEISLNLCVGYFYDTEDQNYKWNIFMNDSQVSTEIGDLVIYKGMDVEHWRDTFICGEKSWQTQVFLHYVDANGPYNDFIWDGREKFGTYECRRELPQGRTSWSAE